MSTKMDLRNLDTSNPGSWPFAIKIVACVLTGLVIIGLSWYFFVADRRTELEGLVAQEASLKADVRGQAGPGRQSGTAQATAGADGVDAPADAAPVAQQERDAGPDRRCLADRVGHRHQQRAVPARRRRRPRSSTPRSRSTCAWSGTYHQFGAFVSGVASLPRVVIMTMHNISLTPRAGKPGLLVLQGTIKTYRYLDDAEMAAAPAARGSK